MTVIINLPGLPVQRLDSVSTIAELRAVPSASLTDGQDIAVDGSAAVGDGGGGLFVWSELSVANDDGVTIIRPDSVPPLSAGRWVLSGSGAFLNSFAGDAGAGLVGYDEGEVYGAGTVGEALQGKADSDLGNLTPVNAIIAGDSVTYPIGNTNETYTQWSFTHADLRNDKREFIYSICANFTHGAPGTGDVEGHKALQYWGVTAKSQVRRAWVFNPLLTLDPTLVDLKYANVAEFDINNFDQDYGDAIGLAGLSIPSVYGVTISGATTSASSVTAGMAIIGHGTPAIFERGFVVGPESVVQAAFDDYSSATASYRDLGTHTHGVDLSGATYSGTAIRLPNNKSLSALNGSGATTNLMTLDASSNIILAGTGVTDVYCSTGFLPITDNSKTLGSISNRWASVWAANGTIQTSDGTLKTDISPIDPVKAGDFIDALEPKSYRWIIGGRRAIMGTERQEVQTGTETKTITMQSAPDKDGKRHDVEITAEVPILEMRDIEVVTGYEDVPGARTHFGFLAHDVKEAFEMAGFEDFGGYVLGEDGTEAIRPDQIMAVMLTELRSLRARVAELEAH